MSTITVNLNEAVEEITATIVDGEETITATINELPRGVAGETGPAGPNTISTSTTTALNGILKGNGANVDVATAGTDYLTPSGAASLYLAKASNLSDLSSASTSRTNLGLGTAAVVNTATGGAGPADSGLIPVFDGSGRLLAAGLRIFDTSSGNFMNIQADSFLPEFSIILTPPTGSGTIALSPNPSGQITDITGNAGTATALETSRNIFGISFNGTANVSGDATNAGHFASIITGGAAGHFIGNNGTTPTLIAGRSAWFADASGNPSFKNGLSAAVTLVQTNGAGGTPSSLTLTNATGLPISTGVSGLGSGVATMLATFSSANIRTACTDETGTGSLVFATSPTLVTPVLGDATASSIKIGGSITDTALPIQIFGSAAQYSVSRTTGTYGMLFGAYDTTTYAVRSVSSSDKVSIIVNNTTQALNVFPSGAITIGTTTENTKAILEISSTTRGFLPPRMTTTQRDAITSPPAGLMIYNTTTNKLNVYTTAWEAVTSA